MRVCINRLTVGDICDITINRVDCTFENIEKAINFFEFNYILLTVDSLRKPSHVFELLNSLDLRYTESFADPEFIEVNTLVPAELTHAVLENVVKEDPENIFISNLLNADDWIGHRDDSPESLLIGKHADAFLVISRDTHTIFVSFRKSNYSCKEVIRKIRSNFCSR